MNKPSLNVVKGVPPKTLERSSGAYQGLLKDITALYEDAQKRADTVVKKIIRLRRRPRASPWRKAKVGRKFGYGGCSPLSGKGG